MVRFVLRLIVMAIFPLLNAPWLASVGNLQLVSLELCWWGITNMMFELPPASHSPAQDEAEKANVPAQHPGFVSACVVVHELHIPMRDEHHIDTRVAEC